MPLHVVNNIINQHATALDASTQSCVTFWMAKTMDSLITSRLLDRKNSCFIASHVPLRKCTSDRDKTIRVPCWLLLAASRPAICLLNSTEIG